MAEPLSIAGSIAGLLSLGNEVFRLVYRYTTAVKNAEKEIGDLKRELEALNGVLYNVGIVARELEQDPLRTPAIRLDHVNSCISLLHRLKENLGELKITAPSKIEKSFRKLTWPFKSSETQSIVSEIRICRDTVAIALSADSFCTLLESLSLQKNIKNELEDVHGLLQKRNEIQDRIHLDERRTNILKTYFFVDAKLSFSINTKLRYPTTGSWLSGDPVFQNWLNGNASCLWLSGIPGAGKTVLSTLVIEDCIKRSGAGRAVAYFYCDYKDKNSQDPVKLLGTLASQIARQAPEAFELLERYHERWNPENSLRVNPDAKDLLSLLKKMICVFDDVRLVVDALDECGDNTRLISNLLKELASSDGANVSLALFSRDEADIRDILTPPFSKHVEIAAHTEDVEQYARADIENRVLEKKLRVINPELKEEIVLHLVEKADGMFRWVTCQLDFLSEFINERQIRRALLKLPTGLDETYRRLLQRIKPAARSMVRRVLHWTIAYPGRLSILELTDAIAIDIEAKDIDEDSKVDEDTLKRECSSLLRHVRGNKPEIAHFTVQEYLEKIDINDPEIGNFRIVKDAAEAIINRVFLSYICSPQFDRKPPITLDERKKRNKKFPLYSNFVHGIINDGSRSLEDEVAQQFWFTLFNPLKTYNFIDFVLEQSFDIILGYAQDEYQQADENFWEIITKTVLSGNFRPLHAAAMMHLPKICKYLVNQGCDVNHLSSLGTPLQFAAYGELLFISPSFSDAFFDVREGLSETITVLIESGAACQLRNEGEICSLSLFAYLNGYGEKTVFRRLLEFGLQISQDLLVWIESAPEDLKEAFFWALSEAEVAHLSKETRFSLLQIANKSRIIAPKILLDRYSSETQQVSDEGFRNLVFEAIQFDQPEKLKELIKDARFWERIDSYGRGGNHLHLAAKSGSVQAFKVLLNSNPSEELTMEKMDGMTVWHLAARNGGLEMLETLVDEFGTEAQGLTSESGVGTSPLTEAITADDEQAALYLLESFGTALEKPGNPPLLHLATTMGMSQVVQKLAEDGFNPKVTSADGSNALFFVTSKTTIRTVETLLDLGLDPKESRPDGKTPLHAALGILPEGILGSDFQPRFASDKIIEKLISNDVIHMTDQNGNDPWYYYCTEYLQENGLTESCVALGKSLTKHGCLEAHERAKATS
ncbi:hypothetical protein BS50DRAFT_234023 [Corynespora cassiicola Philippines]|uniref:Nephrocystin 3-like N-terminal domain-containing protein n=1 Tax=Corynespora cassiicola Philippines TaxID=1448308 RepID=A0A2T2P1Y0_CORCC|nr:hypothetical protein BS50DRAFT_234023 [Corynespora cassiicola Philippines]